MNVNDPVAVKLTRRGAFLLNEQNRYLMYRFPIQKLKADYRRDDYYENNMWIILRDFGTYFQIGQEPPYTDMWPTDPNKPTTTTKTTPLEPATVQ